MLGTVHGEFIILYYVYFTVFEKPQLAWGWLIRAVFFKIIAFIWCLTIHTNTVVSLTVEHFLFSSGVYQIFKML